MLSLAHVAAVAPYATAPAVSWSSPCRERGATLEAAGCQTGGRAWSPPHPREWSHIGSGPQLLAVRRAAEREDGRLEQREDMA